MQIHLFEGVPIHQNAKILLKEKKKKGNVLYLGESKENIPLSKKKWQIGIGPIKPEKELGSFHIIF